MSNAMTIEQLNEMRGADVYDSAGEKIGTVEEIFYDEGTSRPEWIGIGTGFFGTKRVLVPVEGASAEADGFRVPYAKEQVKDAPDIDDDRIDDATERDLYAYYGLGTSDSTLAEEQRSSGDGTQSVTRSEEELRVGKRQVEAGKVRLRKWVETEPVQAEVELQRETARVTREPVDEAVSDRELGNEEIEVPLHAEEAVVEKRTVAKERVGLETKVETDRQTIEDEVRKERVEVDGDVDEDRR